jgi:hypothetical protein
MLNKVLVKLFATYGGQLCHSEKIMDSATILNVSGDFEDACRNIEDPEARQEICLVADSLRLGGEHPQADLLKQFPYLLFLVYGIYSGASLPPCMALILVEGKAWEGLISLTGKIFFMILKKILMT